MKVGAILRLRTLHHADEEGLTRLVTMTIFVTLQTENQDLDEDKVAASVEATTTTPTIEMASIKTGIRGRSAEGWVVFDAKPDMSFKVITRGEVTRQKKAAIVAIGGTEDLEAILEDLTGHVQVKDETGIAR